MKVSGNTVLIDNYFRLLRGLSRENKIKLMAKLSGAIAEEVDTKENPEDKFFGAFKSNKSTEDMIDEIRNSRTFNRTIEPF